MESDEYESIVDAMLNGSILELEASLNRHGMTLYLDKKKNIFKTVNQVFEEIMELR